MTPSDRLALVQLPLWTLNEVELFTGCCEKTCRNIVEKCEPYKAGGVLWVEPSRVFEYIKSHPVMTKSRMRKEVAKQQFQKAS